jgi:hypothetical protein
LGVGRAAVEDRSNTTDGRSGTPSDVEEGVEQMGDGVGADVSGGAVDRNQGSVLLKVGWQGFVPGREAR